MTEDEDMVIAVDLTKTYGSGEAEVHALAGVGIRFARSQMTAVMGPSGSGKSTLLHCLSGLERPTAGEIHVDGRKLTGMDDKQRTRLRRETIGFIFQSFNLIPALTAEENIMLPARIARQQPDQAWFDKVVAVTGLADRLDHRPDQLSGGQQQRVACARALITRPAIVFADEPTGNLDTAASQEVLALLRQSVDELAQTVIMVTHDPSAAGISDRVIFLRDGKIVDETLQPDAASVSETMTKLTAATERGAATAEASA